MSGKKKMAEQQPTHILVVEDDEQVSNKFKRSLIEIGDVKIAKNAKEVFSQIAAFSPQLVLLDLVLEKEKEYDPWEAGMKILEGIKKLRQGISIIVITGRIEPEIESMCRKQGIAEFFVKPVSMQKLLDAVKSALEEQNRHIV